MSKYYNNKSTTPDGIVFDSKKEAKRWTELKLLERAGQITNLQRQVKFVLIPAQYETVERYSRNGQRLKDGQKLVERECCYIADFVYTDSNTNEVIIEDTKGFKTKDYVIKRKIMRFKGHKITEI